MMMWVSLVWPFTFYLDSDQHTVLWVSVVRGLIQRRLRPSLNPTTHSHNVCYEKFVTHLLLYTVANV